MKRLLSISLTALAILLTVSFAVMPHHHHGKLACIVMESCDSSDDINDQHPEHHNAGDTDRGESCSIEMGFISSTITGENKCKVSSCDNSDHLHLFPILTLFADYILSGNNDSAEPPYGEFAEKYESAYYGHNFGLRAPPYYLS